MLVEPGGAIQFASIDDDRPVLGVSRPAIICSSVLLPQPDKPSRQTNSPAHRRSKCRAAPPHPGAAVIDLAQLDAFDEAGQLALAVALLPRTGALTLFAHAKSSSSPMAPNDDNPANTARLENVICCIKIM